MSKDKRDYYRNFGEDPKNPTIVKLNNGVGIDDSKIQSGDANRDMEELVEIRYGKGKIKKN